MLITCTGFSIGCSEAKQAAKAANADPKSAAKVSVLPLDDTTYITDQIHACITNGNSRV